MDPACHRCGNPIPMGHAHYVLQAVDGDGRTPLRWTLCSSCGKDVHNTDEPPPQHLACLSCHQPLSAEANHTPPYSTAPVIACSTCGSWYAPELVRDADPAEWQRLRVAKLRMPT